MPDINPEWLAEFEAAARRPLRQRFKYAFIKTYKPVLDDAPSRSFETMEEYRQWCEENLSEVNPTKLHHFLKVALSSS